MSGQEAPEALTDILSRMKKHKTNAEFLMNIDLGSLSSGRDVTESPRGREGRPSATCGLLAEPSSGAAARQGVSQGTRLARRRRSLPPASADLHLRGAEADRKGRPDASVGDASESRPSGVATARSSISSQALTASTEGPRDAGGGGGRPDLSSGGAPPVNARPSPGRDRGSAACARRGGGSRRSPRAGRPRRRRRRARASASAARSSGPAL